MTLGTVFGVNAPSVNEAAVPGVKNPLPKDGAVNLPSVNEPPLMVTSVTAAASTWDSMWNLGSETLNKAVTVKLTRTLAIIPITLGLSLIRAKKSAKEGKQSASFSLKRSFPMFILYFVIAAIITTVCIHMGIHAEVFQPVKELSKFLIIMAMAAIGLNSNVIQLIKTGGKPIVVGASCWCGITIVSLMMQHIMKIW